MRGFMYEKDVDYVLPVGKEEKDSKKTSGNKKKIFVIISVIAIVLVAVGVVVFSFFSEKSIKGDWELIVNPEIAQSTPDEIEDSERVYYSFTKPGEYGDGTYKTYYNGGVEEGEYKLSEKGGKKYIYLGTENLEYKIKGSKLFGSAKLTITYPEYTNEQTGQSVAAQDYVFVQEKAPKYEKESYDSFKTEDSLLGKWTTNDRSLAYYVYELSYTQTVEFMDNGILTIRYESTDLALDRYMYYAYTVEDNKITFSLVTDKDTEYTVSYEFDENGNLRFIDDKTSSSIFADAFFSDVTYYTPDNLPEKKATADQTAE